MEVLPQDLEYLGANSTDIRRNVLRLKNQGMLDKVMEGFGRATENLIAEYESTKSTSDESRSRGEVHEMTNTEPKPASHHGLSVFISHSSKDAALALALIDLLKDALGLTANQIRCSSVDGYRLPVGVNTEKQLREEVNAAKVVIGLVTPNSLTAAYVMFELGARWGADRFVAPLLAGVKFSELGGPLSLLNALDATNAAQLHQLVSDISQRLNLPPQSPASYERHVTRVKELAEEAWNKEEPNDRKDEPTKTDRILSVMTPNKTWRRTDIAALSEMSEGDTLQALRRLRLADKAISLDVDEEPKETFWRRID